MRSSTELGIDPLRPETTGAERGASSPDSRASEAEKLETKNEYCLRKGRMGRIALPTPSGGAGGRRSFLVDDIVLRRLESFSCNRSPSRGVWIPSLSSVPALLQRSGSGDPESEVGGLREGRWARLGRVLRGTGCEGRSGMASSKAASISCEMLSTSVKLEKISPTSFRPRMGREPTEVEAEQSEVEVSVLVVVAAEEDDCADSTVEVRERLASVRG